MTGLRSRILGVVGPYLPERYRSYGSRHTFPMTGAVFLRNLKRHRALRAQEGPIEDAVGVVVVPWVSTAVPWYSIMLAIGLARRGRKVVLLWDDTGFPEMRIAEQNQAIAPVLDYVSGFLPVMRLSDEAPHPAPTADAAQIERLSGHIVTWCLRGALPTERELPMVRAIRAALVRCLPLVRSALDRTAVDCLLVPGGVYGTSGVYLLAGRERGRRVATFDADRSVAQLCVDGVAAQNADLPRAFRALWSSDEETKRQAIATARSEFQSRAEGSDRYGYQTVQAQASTAEEPTGVLIPLNVEFDTAALGRHVHFADTVDWLTSTITAILEVDAGPVTVRQHPSERRPSQRSTLDMAAILRERFGHDPRCRFVAAEDPISSYDLLRSARLVLPFTSNIGIEAAAMGKPVLAAGASFYADLGFVWSAASRDEYFELLHRGVTSHLEPWPDQEARAWVCYYLVGTQNPIWTDFTSQPEDFWRWCRRSPDVLFAEPEVSDILEAIDTDVPVALLRHRRASSRSDR